MKRIVFSLLLVLLLLSAAFAEAMEADAGVFVFDLPAELKPIEVSQEQKRVGMVYAAQSDSGDLRLVVNVQKVKRSGDTSTAAFIDWRLRDGNAELFEPIMAGDTEFAISCENVAEAGENVCIRTAVAVYKGEQITFLIIDRGSTRSDLPEKLVRSVKWTK